MKINTCSWGNGQKSVELALFAGTRLNYMLSLHAFPASLLEVSRSHLGEEQVLAMCQLFGNLDVAIDELLCPFGRI